MSFLRLPGFTLKSNLFMRVGWREKGGERERKREPDQNLEAAWMSDQA